MKKLLVMVTVVFMLFALTACGSNSDTQDTSGTQETRGQTTSSDELRFDIPFYGPHWDNEPWMEVTIHSDYTVVSIDSINYDITRVIDGERISDTTNEFIKLRVTFTNTNENKALGIGSVSMRNQYYGLFQGASHIPDPGAISPVLDYNVFDKFHEQYGIDISNLKSVEPVTTEERYFLFPFVGNGEYTFVVSYEREETKSGRKTITATINS